MFSKKGIRSAAAYILAVIMAFSFPISAAALTTSTSPYTNKTYTHSSAFDGYDRHDGIDVSAHNGDQINWQSVKADGIEYAVIRAGFTGYTKSRHSINADTQAVTNIKNAQAAGLPLGVYWFSQALNESEARAEAQKTLEIISGYDLQLPVFFDYEFYGVAEGRLDSAWREGTITKSQMTANARAFCEVIESAGYETGIYANKSFLTSQLDAASLANDYSIWLAHFTTQTDYTGDYYMWQYTEEGKVDGISGNVDCDFMYLPNGTEIGGDRKVTGFNVYGRGDGGTDLYLEWNEVGGADKYEVYIVSANSETLKGTVTENRFTFTDLSPAWEYDVRVKAYSGDELIAQNHTYRVCAAPSPVQNLSVSLNGNAITASWDVQASHGYYIQWSTDPTFAKNVNGSFITGSGSTKYTINADNAQDYYVRVRAWKWYEGYRLYSDFSAPVKPAVPLSAPTGFNVYGRGDGGTDLYLDWNDVAGADGYRVYINNGKQDLLQGETTQSRYTFTELVPAWEYDVKVVAYNDVSASEAMFRICAAPSPVNGLQAEADEDSITASWDVQASHGYYIQWSTDPNFVQNVNGAFITGSGSTKYTINVDNAQDYYVRVRAWKWYQNTRLYSDFSAPVKPDGALSAPTGFNVYGRGDGGTDLYLEWNEVSGAEKYEVYIVSANSETLKGTVEDSRFVFTDLSPAWEYDVKVVAYGGGKTSEAMFRVCAAPSPVNGLQAEADEDSVTATWDVQASHGYYIQWSTDPAFAKNVNGSFITGSGSTKYTINVDNAQDYYVRVRAWKWYEGYRLYSDFSAPVKPDGVLSAPTGFNVYGRGDGGTDLYLDWDDVAGAEGYRVYIHNGSEDLLQGDIAESKFTFTELTPAWEYDVKVVAYSGDKTSEATYRVCAAPEQVENVYAVFNTEQIVGIWDPVTSHGYVFQWSKDKDFSDIEGSVSLTGTDNVYYELSVSVPTDYYIRVRAWKNYNGSYIYGDFSEPLEIKPMPVEDAALAQEQINAYIDAVDGFVLDDSLADDGVLYIAMPTNIFTHQEVLTIMMDVMAEALRAMVDEETAWEGDIPLYADIVVLDGVTYVALLTSAELAAAVS